MEWFKTNPAWKVASIIFVLVIAVVIVEELLSFKSGMPDRSRYQLFMDSETGKTFYAELKPGMQYPVISPYTGRPTGYEPEACYWNADGTAKSTPTYVILNSQLGKREPTFCPDCGRLVVDHNPPPGGGRPPPPTREEYANLHPGEPHPAGQEQVESR